MFDLFKKLNKIILKRMVVLKEGYFPPKTNYKHYPSVIKNKVDKINFPIISKNNWWSKLPSTGWIEGNGLPISDYKIPLASKKIIFGDTPPNWGYNWEDKQDIFSINRFIWLLDWVSNRPRKEFFKDTDNLIIDWILKMQKEKKHLCWETYSCSERVVNWLIYFCASNPRVRLNQNDMKLINQSLLDHLEYIVNHLEYFLNEGKNHVINNARALYFGGQFLGIPNISSLARKLLITEANKLISDNGFLVEGSSHYQLLISRTLLEINWVALSTNDKKFVKKIKPLSKKMHHSCTFFNTHGIDSFPKIGDVSPDCSIAWLYSLVDSENKERSWSDLWSENKLYFPDNTPNNKDISLSNIDNWVKINNNSWKLFTFLHGGKNEYPLNHGHSDFGSFILLHDAQIILNDPGRFNYDIDNLDRNGYDAKSHNTVLIDGMPPIPPLRDMIGMYPLVYTREPIQNTSLSNNNHARLSWYTDGFSRLGEKIDWKRDITITKQLVTIYDEFFFQKNKKRNIEIRYQFDSKIELTMQNHDIFFSSKLNKKLFFHLESNNKFIKPTIVHGKSYKGIGGANFPNYGEKKDTYTLIIQIPKQSEKKVYSKLVIHKQSFPEF